MFERYTEKARRVIFYARYEASEYGAKQIDAEHILLGLLREDTTPAAHAFNSANVSQDAVATELRSRMVQEKRISTSVDLPLSAAATQVLAQAAKESRHLRHHHIGTEHLLLGLLGVENTLACAVLKHQGVTLTGMQEILSESAREEKQEDAASENTHWWVEQLSVVCLDRGLVTESELAEAVEKVSELRQMSVTTEALLQVLINKGLTAQRKLSALADELSNEDRFREFLENLPER